jgi:hypothetical protein
MSSSSSIQLDIVFTRPRGFAPLSYAIRAVEGTPYSHVGIQWRSPTLDVELNYEAVGTGVRFVGAIQFDHNHVVVKRHTLHMTEKQHQELMRYCILTAGREYGSLQILGMGLTRLLRLGANPTSDGTRTLVCSELIGYILIDILGLPVPLRLEVDGPRALDEWLELYSNSIV